MIHLYVRAGGIGVSGVFIVPSRSIGAGLVRGGPVGRVPLAAMSQILAAKFRRVAPSVNNRHIVKAPFIVLQTHAL